MLIYRYILILNTIRFSFFKEIPEDEIELGKDELLVPVAHFSKVKISSFSVIDPSDPGR